MMFPPEPRPPLRTRWTALAFFGGAFIAACALGALGYAIDRWVG